MAGEGTGAEAGSSVAAKVTSARGDVTPGSGNVVEGRADAGAEPSPSRWTCADLPGALRSSLQLSGDGKTVYYVERAPKTSEDEREQASSVYAFDIARGTPTLVVSEVSLDSTIAPDGTVVFTRPVEKFNRGRRNRVLMIKPPGKDAVAVTSDTDTVSDVTLDSTTSTIVFLKGEMGNQLWKVPLAGGKPVKMSPLPAYVIFGATRGSVIVSYSSMAARRPIAGGASTELVDLRRTRVVGVHDDQLVLLDKSDRKLSAAPLTAPAKRTELAIRTDELLMRQSGGRAYLIAKHGDTYEVRTLADVAAPPILVTRGVRPADIVHAHDRLVVLANVDSDNNGDLDFPDETDLCFASPGPEPIDVHARTVPKQLAGVASRLAPLLASGPLAGATLRFSSHNAIDLTVDSVPADTTLRALIEDIQTKVTQLSGMPRLSVAVRARVTGQRAVSVWDDSAGGFIVTTGMGTAQLADRTQYLLEVNPRVKMSFMYSYDHIGEATCSGTVKNISDRELSNIEVNCAESWTEDPRRGRVKLKPATLAPGKTATYRIPIGYTSTSPGPRLSIFVDGKRMRYFNAYGLERTEQVLAVANKVHETTQLEYWGTFLNTSLTFKANTLDIYVRAPRILAEGPTAALQDAASQALRQFRVLASKNRHFSGVPRLLILRGDGPRIAWNYANHKLTEGAPRDD